MNAVKLWNLMLLIPALLYFPGSFALSTDRNQPINVNADSLDIDDNQHISTYQGNVEMRQGSLHIKADTIVFHFNDKNELQRLEITGSPATLKQLTDNHETMTGSARKIIYSDNLLLLKLNGEASFKSNADSIESEWISINTQTESIQAGSIKGENRVHMLIQPSQSGQDSQQ